jgi:HAD superfamily hydrolase (TIGR01509 family)
MNIRALLFDFDGLILDTETPDVEAWKSIYMEHGFEYPEESWSQNIGGWGVSTFDPADSLQRLTQGTQGAEALRRRHRARSDEMIAREPIRDGVMEYLEAAGRLHVMPVVVSSSERAWVEPHLVGLGLMRHFERVICGDEVAPGRTKPHPDLFLKALADLQLRADEAVVLEDSPHGVTAARAAGIFVVAVPNPITSLLPLDGADLIVKSLAELPLGDLLKRAERGSKAGVASRPDSGRRTRA